MSTDRENGSISNWLLTRRKYLDRTEQTVTAGKNKNSPTAFPA
jgi:hypothetical protein